MRYEDDINSEFAELFLFTQELILSLDTQIKIKKNQCQTSYNLHNRCICTLKTIENGIYLTIAQGVIVEKKSPFKYKILKGDGKIVKHIKYGSIDEIDIQEFKELLEEVIVVNFEKDG